MIRGRADHLELGNWNCVCYECGRKRKASTMVKNWQGYYVCKEHWEPRQPQDFVRNVPDVITPPWAQPPSDTFIQYCTPWGSTAIPWYAIPGCSIPGKTDSIWDLEPPITCLPYIVLVDETVDSSTYIEACTALVVEATLRLDGVIRIR